MMNGKVIVSSPLAPEAIGPYSQAIKSGNMIFLSGQIPLNAKGQMVVADIVQQTHQVIRNLAAVLDVCQAGLPNIVKTTVYLKSMDDFNGMNQVYARYFPMDPPARACVEVSRLPKDVLVEIDAIAVISEPSAMGM